MRSAITVLFLVGISAAIAAGAERPNVILLISDDQGWTDYGFMGHVHIKTPHIDQLASQGLVYERGYVTAPLCRASLAGLATGLYSHQTAIRGNDPVGFAALRNRGKRQEAASLRARMTAPFANYPSFIKQLQSHGYATLQTGKWWEGDPKKHGFDQAMTHGDPLKGGRHGDAGLKIGRQTMEPIYNFIDKAIADDKPFFVWYGVFLPHTPHNAPKRLFDKYRPLAPDAPTAWYWANCEWLDETCGQLVEHLKKKGLYKNTIFVFTCDNGWKPNAKKRNRHDGRSKNQPTEMGIRTPIFVTHAGKIKPARDKTTLASNVDIAPTILRACGIEPPQSMSGLDLRDVAALKQRDRVFVEVYAHDIDLDKVKDVDADLRARVVIDGWDKLVKRPEQTELFDLRQDKDDRNDLAATRLKKVTAMEVLLTKWLKQTKKF
jgi:arylsulfatase A-like enzyme